MTIDDDAPKESAVEVTLPIESVTEVKLDDKNAQISEESAKIKPVTAEEKEPQVTDDREKALDDLKKQYLRQKQLAEAERDARKKAEEYARHQVQQAQYASNQVQDSNLKIIENAIQTTESNATHAERAYAEAMAAGDYAGAAKAQRALAQAESHLLQLENGRQRLQEQLQEISEGAVQQPRIPSFEPQIPNDPVEMYAARLAPKSAQWLRAHPEAVEKIGRLTRAHEDALEDGIAPESSEYFRYIESRLGYGEREPEYEQPRAQPAPKKSMMSAPVSSNPSYSSSRGAASNTMTLSPNEVEVALLMEPELPREKAIESYARNKAMLIKQGKLTA
jgi:hypothetical protein